MNKKGFTLIELMIVFSIMGISVALAVPSLSLARSHAICRKMGYKLINGTGPIDTFGINTRTFEVSKINTKNRKVERTIGVLNVREIPIHKWELLNWSEKQQWLIKHGTEKRTVSKHNKNKKIVPNNEVGKAPPVLFIDGFKYYREDKIPSIHSPKNEDEVMQKNNEDVYSKKTDAINSFLRRDL